jgi:hypothetical protein
MNINWRRYLSRREEGSVKGRRNKKKFCGHDEGVVCGMNNS